MFAIFQWPCLFIEWATVWNISWGHSANFKMKTTEWLTFFRKRLLLNLKMSWTWKLRKCKIMKVRGISYAGCGFKGTYHFGATAALKDHLGLGLSILPVETDCITASLWCWRQRRVGDFILVTVIIWSLNHYLSVIIAFETFI